MSSLEWRSPWRWLWVLILFSLCGIESHTIAENNHTTCYFPAGVVSPGRPCHPKAPNSGCCSPGFTCLSNGVCEAGASIQKDFKYTLYRSGCTDLTWKDPSCPHFCISPEDNRTGGHGLQICSETQGTYCCRRDGVDCCLVPELVVKLGRGDPVAVIAKLPNPERPTPPAPPHVAQPVEPKPKVRNYARDTIIGAGAGFAAAALAFLGGCICWTSRRRKRRQGRMRELEGRSASKIGIQKEVSVSGSALGDPTSPIELQPVTGHGTTPPETESSSQQLESLSPEPLSRPHTRQQAETSSESVRRTGSRDELSRPHTRQRVEISSETVRRTGSRDELYRPHIRHREESSAESVQRMGSRDEFHRQVEDTYRMNSTRRPAPVEDYRMNRPG